jgi:type II secretory pathway pseudopilin PulG
MHFDFASALNLVSTVTLIGALVFTGLQVRAANRARREQAAVTVIQMAALSENSARILELLGQVPESASAAAIDNLDAEAKRQILEFGLRLEVTGYMVSHGMVDLQIVNDLGGGAILGFWSRAKNWSEERRKRTGQDEFLEWCEWLATQIAQYRATRPYVPAYSRARAS